MGVDGVAWATLIAQASSAVLVLYTLYKSKESYHLILKDLKLDMEMFKKMINIGLPAGFQQSITAFSNIFVQGYINVFGSSVMAGWSSYLKVDSFVLLPMQSIALASTTFVGQNIGAKQLDRAKQGTKTSLIISVTTTIVLSILLNILGKYVLYIFTTDQEVIQNGMMMMRIFSPFYFVMCFTQIYAGALRGAGDSKAPMIIMLSSFVVFRQLSLFIGTKFFSSVEYVIFTYPMGWVLAASLMTYYYHQKKWLKKLYNI